MNTQVKFRFSIVGLLIIVSAFSFCNNSYSQVRSYKSYTDSRKTKTDKLSRIFNVSPFSYFIGKDSDFFAVLNKSLVCKDTLFKEKIYIDRTIFKSPFYLSKCEFDSAFEIVVSNFNIVKFNQNTINKKMRIEECTFDSTTDIEYSYFDDEFFLNSSVFNSYASFFSTHFNEEAYFDRITFNEYVNFDFASFNSTLSFFACTFNKDVTFLNTRLPRRLDLSFVKILDQEIDLSNVIPREDGTKCLLLLEGIDINKIRLKYKDFKLDFNSKYYASNDQKSNLYESLLKRFQNLGYTDSYQELDIEYKYFKEYENGNLTSKIFYRIKQWWWDFGYHKEYIIYWIFIFVLIFTIINAKYIHYLNDKVYTVFTNTEHKLLKRLKIISRVKFAFYYTIFIFFGLKLNYKEIKSFGWPFFYILFVYSLGLVCLAYFANFALSKF